MTHPEKDILIIMETLDRNDHVLGGFHDWIKTIAEHARKVTVIAQKKGEVSLPENVRVYSLGKEERKNKLTQLVRFYYLIIWHRRDYAYVLAHMSPLWILLGAPFWKLTGKKMFLWYAHGSVDFKLKLADRLIKKAFTSTPEGYHLKSGKAEIVGQGIDTDFFTPRKTSVSRESFNIISVGRISASKDLLTLLQAVSLLKSKTKEDIKIKIYGEARTGKDAEYEEKLKIKAKELGIEHCIEWRGAVPYRKMPETYEEADLLVNTSRTGSADKVVLEAMASGINVVSCNEAYQELLGRKLGEKYVFSPHDAEMLSEKIKYFLSHRGVGPELRDEVIRHHNLPSLIKKIIEGIS